MSCEEARDLLYGLLTNELEEPELGNLLEHLAHCDECRAAMSEHVKLHGLLREKLSMRTLEQTKDNN